MTTNSKIYTLANIQGGVVRRDQVLDAGMSRSQVERRVKSGEWRVVSTGGYQLIDLRGRMNRLRAAVAILPNAVASHFSAAAINKIRLVPTDTVSVTVHARTTHAYPGVRIFRSIDLETMHITTRMGLPATTLERTVVYLASCLTSRHLSVVVDDLLASGRCEVSGIRDVLETVARRGRPGVVAMRSVLEERTEGPSNMSVLERDGLRVLRESGFTGFRLEFTIPWTKNRRFDVAFPTQRVAIEWDSRRWHSQKSAMRRDRERDRDALAHGWRILRFTWDDVHEDPVKVANTIRTVLGL